MSDIKGKLYTIVGTLYNVHKELGPGLNEKIYQEGLKTELELQNIPYKREYTVRPIYKGKLLDAEYKLDFLIDDDIIIELKAVSSLTDEHRAQLFNYMHLVRPKAGILVNFSSKSCVLERYLFDSTNNRITTMTGESLYRNK